MLYEVNSRSCSKVRTAYADYKKDVRVISNLLSRLLDSCKLFLIIVDREIYPAKEILSVTGFLLKSLCRIQNCRLNALHLVVAYEFLSIFVTKI